MAAFLPAALFTDHAVLCRGKEIRLFGEAEDGLRMTAVLTDAAGRELARDSADSRRGRFLLRLPPQRAQTGCTLAFSDGRDTRVFSDIALGDVYLAGGQSNMELELQHADEGADLIPVHDNPLVRYFNVPKCPRPGEEADRANRNARWHAVAPGWARDMSGVAYFFAMKLQPRLEAPVGIIDCYWGGTSITCWMDEEALERTAEGQRYLRAYQERCAGKTMAEYLSEESAFFGGLDAWARKADQIKKEHPGCTAGEISGEIGPCPPWDPPAGPGSPFRPHGLFHTMLERVIPAALTGVLFYQGEEDTGRTRQYDLLLTVFIRRLREVFWDDELPFLNVQLPMWMDGAARQDTKTWPLVRLAQQAVEKQVKHTALAVMLDQGEFDNIHPTNKRVVGERLCDCALGLVYGQDAPRPPAAVGKYAENGGLRVLLSAPVLARETGEYLMEIAGDDGAFYPADVTLSGASLLLSSPGVPRPTQARYAWTDYAVVRLFGRNGLPLAPFWLR